MKLNIQFVAVPKAAPFVRIASELISVGYNYHRQYYTPTPQRNVFTYPRHTLPSNPKKDIVEEEECNTSFSPGSTGVVF